MSTQSGEEKKGYKPVIPDVCPVCDVLIRSIDVSVYRRNKACSDCEMHFLYPNKAAWEAGWRPTNEQIIKRLKKRQEEPFFYRSEMYN